eukprot:GHVS01069435.1.p1 GENE.GHVS01069435.1~~GHVS01069435.1.p1  ORF type:complete len:542 (+),score=37.09 GHVS01069435.1:96-1721(+)
MRRNICVETKSVGRIIPRSPNIEKYLPPAVVILFTISKPSGDFGGCSLTGQRTTTKYHFDFCDFAAFWILKDAAWGMVVPTLAGGKSCEYLNRLPGSPTLETKEDCIKHTYETSDTDSSIYATYRNNLCYKHSETPECLKKNHGGYSMTALGSADFNNDVMTLTCTNDTSRSNTHCVSTQVDANEVAWDCGPGTLTSTYCGPAYSLTTEVRKCTILSTACDCHTQGEVLSQGECNSIDCNTPGEVTELVCDGGKTVRKTTECISDSCTCDEGTATKLGPCTVPKGAEGARCEGEQTQTICRGGTLRIKTLPCPLGRPCCNPATFVEFKTDCVSTQGWKCGSGKITTTKCGRDYFKYSSSTPCECNTQNDVIEEGECEKGFTNDEEELQYIHCITPGKVTQLVCDEGVAVYRTKDCTTSSCRCEGDTPLAMSPCRFPGEELCGSGRQIRTTCVDGAIQSETVLCHVDCLRADITVSGKKKKISGVRTLTMLAWVLRFRWWNKRWSDCGRHYCWSYSHRRHCGRSNSLLLHQAEVERTVVTHK